MRTAFLIGLMATTGSAGLAVTQTAVQAGKEEGCVLAKATPTPSPTPTPSGSGKHIPKATLTVRKSGGEPHDAAPAPKGNTKWGNIVLKRGAGATGCPAEQ